LGNKQFWTTFRNSLKEYLLWRTSIFGHIYEELRGATLKSSWGPASGLWRTSLAQLRGPALERISCYHCWKYERIYIIFDIIFVCSIYIYFFFSIFEKANLGLSGVINLELKCIYVSKLSSNLIIKIGAVNRIVIQKNLKLFNYMV
jgi:hypothetical protein